MEKEQVIIQEDNLKKFIIEHFKENALLEISYNRVFIPGKILYVDENANITIQLMGQLLNQRVDINIEEVKSELVEIVYTYEEESMVISIVD